MTLSQGQTKPALSLTVHAARPLSTSPYSATRMAGQHGQRNHRRCPALIRPVPAGTSTSPSSRASCRVAETTRQIAIIISAIAAITLNPARSSRSRPPINSPSRAAARRPPNHELAHCPKRADACQLTPRPPHTRPLSTLRSSLLAACTLHLLLHLLPLCSRSFQSLPSSWQCPSLLSPPLSIEVNEVRCLALTTHMAT